MKDNITQEIREIEKKVERDLKKHWIIFGSISIIILIFIGIYFFNEPDSEIKFNPLDAIVYNSTGLNLNFYHKGEVLFSMSGWQFKLVNGDKEDRLLGKEEYKQIVFDDNGKAYTIIPLDDKIQLEPLSSNPEKVIKIGWFTKLEQIIINQEATINKKRIDILFSSGESSINEAEYIYDFYNNKPYFKNEFSVLIETGNLGEFAYCIDIKDYNIYLPDSTILENDNKLIDEGKTVDIILRQNGTETTNVSEELKESVSEKVDITKKAISRKGSFNKLENNDYRILYNQEKGLAIITHSPNTLHFEDSFLWNSYRTYVPHLGNGEYPPLYVIVVEDPELTYDENAQDWHLTSKQYTSNVKDYIDHVVWEIESGEAEKFNIRSLFNI